MYYQNRKIISNDFNISKKPIFEYAVKVNFEYAVKANFNNDKRRKRIK